MNMTIAILDFGVCLYGGSELSKHLSKCLPQMQKTAKISDSVCNDLKPTSKLNCRVINLYFQIMSRVLKETIS